VNTVFLSSMLDTWQYFMNTTCSSPRLVYWLAASLGSSVRGFGFGMSFLPSLTMLVANIYFIFTLEAAGTIFAQQGETLHGHDPPPAPKQRFWG